MSSLFNSLRFYNSGAKHARFFVKLNLMLIFFFKW